MSIFDNPYNVQREEEMQMPNGHGGIPEPRKEMMQPTAPPRNDSSLFAQINSLTEMSHILLDSMSSLADKGRPLLKPVPTDGEAESSDKFLGSDVATQLHEIYVRLYRLNNQINDFRSALDV